MRTKQRNNLAETARHERVAQNTDVYAVKARNYKGLRRGSPVLCSNNWHIHHAKSGGGQILVCVGGRGYYQEEGKPAIEMKPGDCINIPADVNTGTAQLLIAGSAILQSRFLARRRQMSGVSL